MINALLTGLFNLILTLLATIVQVLMIPINALFSGIFPNFNTQINQIVAAFNQFTSMLYWVISIIPPAVQTIIVLILTVEVALIVVLKSTKLTSKLWSLLQKIKLW